MAELTDTKKLAAHLVQTRYEDIPSKVVDVAKLRTWTCWAASSGDERFPQRCPRFV